MNSILARKCAIVVAIFAAVFYLSFRILFTINAESYYAIAASLILLAAESWGTMLMFLYFLQVWDTHDAEVVPPVAGKKVDVFLPTYNEDAQLLRGSINALNQLDYPHTTYVLDDGRRESVAELCRELGVEYIARENNLHAKAGNLNHALDRTDGEYVIIFDADHIAKPNFISRLVGYFEDPKLAFIQTPHAFYNFDNFQSHVDYKRGVYWEEGQLFYNVIQPGKNCWNANVFCGSAAMFRRSALEEVGLIATETITEDMHTGLRIHSKGWKSLFVNERMISAQAAPDITTFISQRLRWGEGNLSIFAYDNPLTLPGLTLAQRLNYLGSMLGWTTGPAKVALYAAPIMMLFSGVSPVGDFSIALGLVTLIYLLSTWTAVKLVSNGYGRLWNIEVQAMTNFWVQCQCLYRALIRRGRGKFVVTSKRGRQGNSVFGLIMPHITLIALGVAAIVWASAKIFLGVSEDYLGLAVGGLLIGLQSVMAFQVVRKALRSSDNRFSWRHPSSDIHVHYQMDEVQGQAISVDINESGIGIISYMPLQRGDMLDLKLSTSGRELSCIGEVRHCTQFDSLQAGHSAYRVGLQFQDLNTEQLSELWTISANVAVERQYRIMEQPRSERSRKNVAHRLPLEVFSEDGKEVQFSVVSSKLEANMIHFESPDAIEVNQLVPFKIESPAGIMTGQGVVLRGASDGQYQVEFRKFDGQARGVLKSILSSQRGTKVDKVINPTPLTTPWPVVEPVLKSGWLTLAASVLCIAGAWYVWQDQYFLSSVAQQETLTEEQRVKANQVLANMFQNPGAGRTTAEMLDARKLLENMGDTERLAQLEDLLLVEHPDDVGLKLARANRVLEAEKFDEASESFKSLVAIIEKPRTRSTAQERSEVQLGLARSLVGMNQLPAAIDAYSLALEERRDPQTALEMANILVDQKDFPRVEKVLALLPEGFESRLIEARLDVANGKLDRAETSLQVLTIEDPSNSSVRQVYAETLAQNGKTDAAIQEFQTLVNSEYQPNMGRKRIAQLLIEKERFAEAIPILDQLAIDMVQNEEFWVTYVTAVRQVNNISAEAQGTLEEIYRQIMEAPDASVDLKLELAEYFANHQESFKAAKLLGLCADQSPDDLTIRKRYAEVLHDAGRFDEADQQYQLLIKPSLQAAEKKKPGKQAPVEPIPSRRPIVSLASGLR